MLNVKTVLAAFNQEKALVGAFSLIVKTDCETDGSSAAIHRVGHIFGHHNVDGAIFSIIRSLEKYFLPNFLCVIIIEVEHIKFEIQFQ